MVEESLCLGEMTVIPKLRKGCWIRFPVDYKQCRPRMVRKIHTAGIWDAKIHSDCYHNQLRSLYGRVLAITPPIVSTELKQLRYTARTVAKSLGSCYPASLDTVLSYFPTAKQKVYAKAKTSLLAQPLEAKDAMTRAFTKVEKKADGAKDPRMIQYRSTRFNLMLGRFTRPMEKVLYRMRDSHGNKLIAKGMNNRQRANHLWNLWNQIDDPVALSLDLTRWDLHCNVDLLKVLHLFYLTITPDEELAELLKCQLVNRGVTSHGIRYQSTGGIMSGDMTTALGNCALLVIIVLTVFRGIERELPGIEWRVIDDGDDFVVITNACYATRVAELMKDKFTKLGHVLKIESHTEQFHKIEFCQTKPLRHHGVIEMVPNPHKVLASAFMVVGKRDQQEYLRQLWQMRAILHQGQPVLGPIFNTLTKKYPPIKKDVKIGLEYEAARDSRNKVIWETVETESRLLYAEQWGWGIDEQLEVERWFSNVGMPKASDGPNDQTPWSEGSWPLGHLQHVQHSSSL